MSLKLRLFMTYALVILVFLVVVTLGVTLLMRHYVDRQSFSRLEAMTLPIYVQMVASIRGNVTPDQLLSNLQEQADNNGAYILLIDKSGDIVRQLIPTQFKTPAEAEISTLSQGITEPVNGKFTTADGRVFLYSAYPLTRQAGQLSTVDILVLATPKPPAFLVFFSFIWPLFIAAGIALIVSLFMAILLARSIYVPLTDFKNAARQISRGDYSQRIQSKGPKEINELADSFNLMTEDVESAQLRLRHFVADVSHELKSPLTSIHGFAQALLDGTAADDITKTHAVQIIFDESERLKHQVDELLDLSRMQSSKGKFTIEPVDLKEVLEHCVEVFAVQAKQKRATVELKAEENLIVTGDQDRLEQVFNNLIDNAIKNIPSGGKVRIISNRSEGKIARTVVLDDGPGIPLDQLPYVFERFYQVTGVRTGVGLGLAIAKEIVSAHKGTIEASSEPGEGASFTVVLPLKTD